MHHEMVLLHCGSACPHATAPPSQRPRLQAVESANTIVSGLDSGDVVTYVVPVIERLATGEWFTSRVSAAGLFPTAYGRLTDATAAGKLRE